MSDTGVPLTVWLRCVEEIAGVIKLRFPNLTVEETLKLSHDIITAVAKRVEQP